MENKLTLTINNCEKETFKELGSQIKALRKSRGISQEGLSELTNRDRSGLSGYETGSRVPTLYSLYEISNALNYDLRIQFEKKEGFEDMYRKEAFTKEFMDKFMENMNQEGTFEYCLPEYKNMGKEKWQITELTADNVILESDKNNELKLTTVEVDSAITNKRYCPIEIEYRNRNEGFGRIYGIFLDLQDSYTLTDCYYIRKKVLECLSVTAMLQANAQLEMELLHGMKKDFVNPSVLSQLCFTSYCDLKTKFGLNDKAILDIVKIFDLETKSSSFVDILNCNVNETIRLIEEFDKSLAYARKHYVDAGYVNEEILAKLLRVAILEKLSNYASMFIYDGDNDDLEEDIAIGENKKFIGPILDEIDKGIKYCYGWLEEDGDRNRNKESDEIIKELICIFYKEMALHHLDDLMEIAMWEWDAEQYE